MKKFVSIMAIVIIIAVVLVGATACGGTDKSEKFVGTWISVVEDNNYTVNAGTSSSRRVDAYFYAEITEKVGEDGTRTLYFRSYSVHATTKKFVSRTVDNITEPQSGKYRIYTNIGIEDIGVTNSNYSIDIKDDNTLIIELLNTDVKFTFRRTNMTLEEFKATYAEV